MGVVFGVAAYLFWGLAPVYFKAVAHVPAVEVFAHRIIWCAVFMAVVMTLRRGWPAIAATVRDRRTRTTLLATTVFIGGNWIAFIYAVATNQVMQASLGYYITPLMNVLMGFVFLRERLRRAQVAAVMLAAGGVTYLVIGVGVFPWLGLYMATSFGLYGLCRKKIDVGSLVGLTFEATAMSPLAIIYLVVQMARGQAMFARGDLALDALLLLAGVVTAVPLLWFAAATRRLRLSTVGFLMYIAPTSQFILAIAAYGEPFTTSHLVAFTCIWIALAIYSIDTARKTRSARPQPVCTPPE